jgi:hypothetical protein
MMPKGEKRECLRCGKVWVSRVEGRPVQCPRCKQPNWDREARGNDGGGNWAEGGVSGRIPGGSEGDAGGGKESGAGSVVEYASDASGVGDIAEDREVRSGASRVKKRERPGDKLRELQKAAKMGRTDLDEGFEF